MVRPIRNATLIAPASPGAVARSVYPLPGRSMCKSLKLATPAAAVTVVVPVSVAPDGFAPSATVTVFVASRTVSPN